MSGLLDRLRNAERERRALRARRAGPVSTAASAPGRVRHAQAGAAGAAKTKAVTAVSAAEDERFWAEVKRRLAEVERRRRAKDALSPGEVRALDQLWRMQPGAACAANLKTAARTKAVEDERSWAEVERRLTEVDRRPRARDALLPSEARALEQVLRIEASAASAAETNLAAMIRAAADERFWAEVRMRLALAEQRRRVRDSFSPEELRALAQAAGVGDLLANRELEKATKRDTHIRPKVVTPAQQGDAAETALVQANLAAKKQTESLTQMRARADVVAAEGARQRARREAAAAERERVLLLLAAQRAAAELTADRAIAARAGVQAGLAKLGRAGAAWRSLTGASMLAALAFALDIGMSLPQAQSATPHSAASPGRQTEVQTGTGAVRSPVSGARALKIDADAARFAARAAAPGPAPRRMQPRN